MLNLSDIGIIVGLIATLCTTLFFVFKAILHDSIRKDVEKIDKDYEAHKKESMGRRTSCDSNFIRLEGLPKSVAEIKERLLNIELFLRSKRSSATNVLSAAQSPRVLTNMGDKLLVGSGAKLLLDRNMDRYISNLEELAPKTALDVEDNALLVLYKSADTNDDFSPLKTYLYNNPAFEGSPISIVDICFVMSLPLRDEYLKRHPEIPLE